MSNYYASKGEERERCGVIANESKGCGSKAGVASENSSVSACCWMRQLRISNCVLCKVTVCVLGMYLL